jgi:hypothetical protein
MIIERVGIGSRVHWTILSNSWLHFTDHCYIPEPSVAVFNSLPLVTASNGGRSFPFLLGSRTVLVPQLSNSRLTGFSSLNSFNRLPLYSLSLSEVEVEVTLRLTVSRYVLVSSTLVRLATRCYFLSECCCLKFAVLFRWGILSDERTGLQFAV